MSIRIPRSLLKRMECELTAGQSVHRANRPSLGAPAAKGWSGAQLRAVRRRTNKARRHD
jgi:hypothetical protein